MFKPTAYQKDILAFMRKNPHKTCRELAERFDVTPARMGLELRELRAWDRVASTGRTQGTRWYVP